jgi:YbdK family carboxylate-amine ligase
MVSVEPVARPVRAPVVEAIATPPIGATFGVEEEFHLVDPDTLALVGNRELAEAALRGEAGARVQAELSTSQIETATAVCTSLSELRTQLQQGRRQAAAAAGRAGLVPLAASTHPFGSWRQQELTPSPRYAALADRYAALTHRQDICGCHVHVAVPDLDTAVAVMDRARPYLCLLAAMTGSSPFHEGLDTGYDSYRTLWWSRWPTAGPPERLGDAAGLRSVVAELVAAGTITDSTHLYWDVRPSAHIPTVEFRVADVCTDIDDAVLHAALVRSLVRILAARAAAGEPCPDPRPEVLRAARWRAARHGLEERLFSPVTGTLLDARSAVQGLLGELEEDLRAHDEWDEVQDLVARLFRRGTSAARQRRTVARTGDLRAVAAELICATAPR